MSEALLAELQAAWTARPAGFDPEAWWGRGEPDWVERTPLLKQRLHMAELVRDGEPRLGWVLQANSLVWDGKGIAPGSVLVSWDPLYDLRPDALGTIAARFHELKEQGSEAVGLRGMVAGFRDDHAFHMRSRLPLLLTSGRVVLRYDLLFFPALLPGGSLAHNLLPVIALRRGPPICTIPPAELWPRALREAWEGA